MAKKKALEEQELAQILNIVLTAFRAANVPLTLKDLTEMVNRKGGKFTQGIVHYAIGGLRDAGYDIKKVQVSGEERYILVRFGQNDMDNYYRTLGKVETPCILSGDWHVGSFGFSEIALQHMIDDVKRYKIKHIVHPGDFYQGRGVHRMELEDCKTLSTDTQEEWGTEAINKFPTWTTFHIVIGNHEEKIKGNVEVGHDMLLATATDTRRKVPFNYYGHVAKLSLNGKYSILMIHTSGGLTYAKTYKAERVFDSLTERPNLLVTGHMHQLFAVGRPPNVIVCQAGTLQRENSYLLNKGATAMVGYLILKEFTDEVADIEYVRPRVF